MAQDTLSRKDQGEGIMHFCTVLNRPLPRSKVQRSIHQEYAHSIPMNFTTSRDNSQTMRTRVLMKWLQPLALLNLRLLLLPSRLNALNLCRNDSVLYGLFTVL